ncbi:MAG: hypothetical protein OEZ02_12290, partial [Anaerolineae bacterium]|nr:hypothetical protein [Anaerolineae bacterium]
MRMAQGALAQGSQPGYTLEDSGEVLRFLLRAPKRWWAVAGITVFSLGVFVGVGQMVGWAAAFLDETIWRGGRVTAEDLAPIAATFFMVVLSAYMIFYLLRLFASREIVDVNQQAIWVRTELLGLSWPVAYRAEHVRDLRTKHYPAANEGGRLWAAINRARGFVTFDYGAKTYSFAAGGSMDGAEEIIALVKERFPVFAGPGMAQDTEALGDEYQARHTIEEEGATLKVNIPARRRWLLSEAAYLARLFILIPFGSIVLQYFNKVHAYDNVIYIISLQRYSKFTIGLANFSYLMVVLGFILMIAHQAWEWWGRVEIEASDAGLGVGKFLGKLGSTQVFLAEQVVEL